MEAEKEALSDVPKITPWGRSEVSSLALQPGFLLQCLWATNRRDFFIDSQCKSFADCTDCKYLFHGLVCLFTLLLSFSWTEVLHCNVIEFTNLFLYCSVFWYPTQDIFAYLKIISDVGDDFCVSCEVRVKTHFFPYGYPVHPASLIETKGLHLLKEIVICPQLCNIPCIITQMFR